MVAVLLPCITTLVCVTPKEAVSTVNGDAGNLHVGAKEIEKRRDCHPVS
jgi:hypothetical protein